MPLPPEYTRKGHPPIPGCEKGGSFGHLGRGPDTYQDDELKRLGEGVVKWIKQKGNIWLKYYFLDQGMVWGSVQNLMARSEMFKTYIDLAKSIQEAKLLSEPYYKKADGNQARFMLARHHKGEWEDKLTDQETIEELKINLAKISEMAKNGELSQK